MHSGSSRPGEGYLAVRFPLAVKTQNAVAGSAQDYTRV
jgi:hypothetical protein